MWIGKKDSKKQEQDRKQEQFQRMILPHINAAYNLARWLMRNDQDAEDAVQDAYVRAFRFFDGFHGTDGRAWLLRIVRNACYTLLQQQRAHAATLSLDNSLELPSVASNPETIVLQRLDLARLKAVLNALPLEFREVVILRDIEGMSYREIGEIVEIPLGTVMSRLARARRRLQEMLTKEEEAPPSTPDPASRKEFRHEL